MHRVLLVDDEETIRRCLLLMARRWNGVQVVGEAATGRQAVEMARALQPDVIVMDGSMPEMSGIEATRRLKEEMPAVRIIGLSASDGGFMERMFLEAGAENFVPKGGSSCFEAVFKAICEKAGI